jgi:hypothetical protein
VLLLESVSGYFNHLLANNLGFPPGFLELVQHCMTFNISLLEHPSLQALITNITNLIPLTPNVEDAEALMDCLCVMSISLRS